MYLLFRVVHVRVVVLMQMLVVGVRALRGKRYRGGGGRGRAKSGRHVDRARRSLVLVDLVLDRACLRVADRHRVVQRVRLVVA